ncbi:MAG: RDD family protein [Rhizobacter sp.]|nr:RDD family protein [Ferruginibacter sp.]
MERYYTFWRRLGAGIVDSFFIGLLSWIIGYVVLQQGRDYFLVMTVVLFICSYLYSILMTGLLGQTLGKMATGIIVVDQADETHVIGIKRAFYRDSVPLLIQVVSFSFSGWNVYTEPASHPPSEIINEIGEYALWGWFIAELVTMFFNERRRAVHDFLASSVVIGLKGLKFDKHYEALDLAKLQKENDRVDNGKEE